MSRRILVITSATAAAALVGTFAVRACYAQTRQTPPDQATVTLDLAHPLGPSRPLLMGQNFVDVGPWHHAWDEASGAFWPDVTAALREESPTVMRFPGGLFGNQFHWARTIGPPAQRAPFDYRSSGLGMVPATVGADEFMQLIAPVPDCRALNIVNISRCKDSGPGTAEEAAAWVAYCNGTADNTTPIGVDELGTDWHTVGYWAAQRARNGHAAPYPVPYWELGNEVNQGDKPSDDFLLTADEYVERGLRFLAAMKRVDPTIKVGIVGWTDVLAEMARGHGGDVASRKGGAPWLATVLPAFKGRADFFVHHYYNSIQPDYSRDREKYWKAVMGFGEAICAPRLHQLAQVLQEKAGGMPIWLTEYNRVIDWHQGEKGMREQYTLSAALAAADLMMIQIREPTVECANFFEFMGGMGTCYCGDGRTVLGIRTERAKVLRHPSHWAFALFSESFRQGGGAILDPKVQCATESLEGYTVPLLNAAAVSLEGGRQIDIFLLNKHLDRATDCTVSLGDAAVKSVEAVELNSWDPNSTAPLSDDNADGQKVYVKAVEAPVVRGGVITGRLAAHSLVRWRVGG